ncbi:Zinc dependent phospholipase C [Desulfacinum hydrothermale DSM 13146]|uniref:Zinc dependent phospholipase C n=1 Tax=Desulfacinum hydrothermale DSM 13146 TaxID=1121390 RepID=A0A1W1XPE5_9BACT|nr:zinc dependent phospholipase C family protein [Desulfacinum hydrothermale]SMC25747.1 Zinc dependent phospholipase C [Desulfacinum hydrothermale DSM 13146]
MPKERFHMLLAREAAGLLNAGQDARYFPLDRVSFLLGAVMPDTLFYDIPRFTLSRVGRRLHRYQGEAGAQVCRNLLRQSQAKGDRSYASWLMGFMSHLLADAYWHGLVAYYSEPPFGPCRYYRLKPKSCHLWLEGQLEAQWIPLVGPEDGFCRLLDGVRHGLWRTHPAPRYFRRLLQVALPRHVPAERGVRRCLYWQATLLRFFSDSRTDRLHEVLLSSRWGRYLGSLVVPREACLAELMARVPPRPAPNGLPPFDGRLLARSVAELAHAFAHVVREIAPA